MPAKRNTLVLPAMFLTAALLVGAMLALATMTNTGEQAMWMLSQLLGLTILLSGVYRLVRLAFGRTKPGLDELAFPVAVVLAGGMLCSNALGAALGLGALACVAAFAGRTRERDDPAE